MDKFIQNFTGMQKSNARHGMHIIQVINCTNIEQSFGPFQIGFLSSVFVIAYQRHLKHFLWVMFQQIKPTVQRFPKMSYDTLLYSMKIYL